MVIGHANAINYNIPEFIKNVTKNWKCLPFVNMNLIPCFLYLCLHTLQ
jgi:hypothetical protein